RTGCSPAAAAAEAWAGRGAAGAGGFWARPAFANRARPIPNAIHGFMASPPLLEVEPRGHPRLDAGRINDPTRRARPTVISNWQIESVAYDAPTTASTNLSKKHFFSSVRVDEGNAMELTPGRRTARARAESSRSGHD